MSPSTTLVGLNTRIEDVLSYLPISSTKEYAKGQVIYSPDDPSRSLYLVVSGKVETSQIAGNGKDILLEIVRPQELFGESAFLDVPCRIERATAFEKASVMTWAIADVEELVMKRPRLAVAMLQVLARRNVEFTRRIESFSTEDTGQRLSRALIRFSERLGTREEDGSFKMMPVTHDQLSRYVGASREIVTHHMRHLRRQGYVNYSRRGIVLYRDAMRASISA
jgi:CRP/FNR family cyclic AMP-dependent transcriptional regulator